MRKLLTILFLCPLFAYSTNYYFKSTGSDAATGLSDAQAWQTITKFNSFFASLSPGDSVLFNRGDTWYGALTISRSGSSGSPIIIGAYGTGAKPIITGLATVSAWTSLGSNIYESTAAATSLTTLNMVTFQDTLQPLGRWPKLSAANGGYLTHQTHSTNVSITSNAIASALSYVGGELVALKNIFVIDRATITAQTSTTVTATPLAAPDHPGFDYDYIDNHGFFFQNHSNACTVLGEWAFVSSTKKIRMNFTGSTPASFSIKVSDIDNLVTIASRTYITFDNLQFLGSNARTFSITGSNNIQVNSCNLNFAGINAIYANSSSNTIRVYNCTISNSNNSAIYSSGADVWTIQNNIVTNTAINRGMGQPGDAQYNGIAYVEDNSLVEYNRVINTGYIGIGFIGNNVTVRNNFIDSFCMVKTDGGAIYTYANPTQTGRVITGNICINGFDYAYGHDAALDNPYAAESVGIYLDGGAQNVNVTGNTVANCDGFGIQLGSSQNVLVEGNTIFNCSVTQIYGSTPNAALDSLDVRDNILFAKYPDQLIMSISLASNYLSSMGVFDSNYYCRPIFEPQNINGVTGYSNTGPNYEWEDPYDPYNDGGIIVTYTGGANSNFWSLDKWKIHTGLDDETVKTYATVADVDDIRFEYNATNAAADVSLGNFTYKDVTGAEYTGDISLPAYSSIILLNPVAISTILHRGRKAIVQ